MFYFFEVLKCAVYFFIYLEFLLNPLHCICIFLVHDGEKISEVRGFGELFNRFSTIFLQQVVGVV